MTTARAVAWLRKKTHGASWYIPFLRKRESTLVMSHRAEGIDVGRVTKDMTRDKNTKKNIIRQWLNIEE